MVCFDKISNSSKAMHLDCVKSSIFDSPLFIQFQFEKHSVNDGKPFEHWISYMFWQQRPCYISFPIFLGSQLVVKDQGRAKGFPVKIWCKTRCIFCALHLISVWSSCSNNTVAVVQYTFGYKFSYSDYIMVNKLVFISDMSLIHIQILGLAKVNVVHIIHRYSYMYLFLMVKYFCLQLYQSQKRK